MKILKWLTLAGAVSVALAVTHEAQACGGFFCGRQPVDQTAERIVFEIGDGMVTMTTQISFTGEAADFAWIVPLPEVPDPDSLAVFPQRALTALDANTGPTFAQPSECYPVLLNATGGAFDAVTSGTSTSTTGAAVEPPVQVHVREEVGSYDVAVVESEDPEALITWLRDEGYRVTEPMEPYIELYTNEGMKFLALKLLEAADVNDITPFRFSLPGDTPSIPLRMTALAAEPEMSIAVFMFGEQRYEAKNWENVTIEDEQIRFQPNTYPLKTNWNALVAQGVDAADGRGWVTEFAGPTTDLDALLQNQLANGNFATPEDEEAAGALAGILQEYPYLTRFYTRASAEEMTLDPVFGRSNGDDVASFHQLVRVVDGVDQCPDAVVSADLCAFVTCGAGGVCRTVTEVDDSGIETRVAACGCVPGATARTTFSPDGTPTVICQDRRMSFLNPGDQEAGNEALPDPCATFSCGPNGSCVPVNMTPTCVCDKGFVATGGLDEVGLRVTTCVVPDEAIPDSFYEQRLPNLPEEIPGGIDVEVPPPEPDPTTGGTTTASMGGTTSVAAGGSGGTSPMATGGSGGSRSSSGGAGGSAPGASSSRSGGGCSFGAPASPVPLVLLGFAGVLARRRQRRRATAT